MPSLPEFGAVVLAGGASTRMGTDKAFLTWKGVTLLQRQIATLHSTGAKRVWISGRPGVDYTSFDCPVVLDSLAGAGPLAGLVATLRASQGNYPWLLALAVDLPCMTPEYLSTLVAVAGLTGLGILPRRGPYFEPLAAIYPVEAALAAAEAQLASGRFALQELANSLVTQGAAMAHAILSADYPLFANWNDATGPQPASPGN